jgi:hypothetical protein
MYLKSGKPYLDQLIFSNNPLSEEEDYIINLMSSESLSAYVDELKTS